MKQLLTLFTSMAFLLLATDANADIFTTVNNGDYGNVNHWDLGYAPGPSDTAIINQPNPLAISFTVVNVGCNGSSTGKITAQVTGGTKPPPSAQCNGESYSFTWSNSATSRINDNVVADTYFVMVTDKNGCVIFGTATVTEPTALDITDVQIDPANNGNSKLTVFATGGTTPYKYKRIPVNANFQGYNIFNNVPEGTYQIVVRDNKLCTDTVEVQLSGGGGGGSNLVQTDETDHLKADEDYEVLEEEIMAIPTNSFNPESVSASQKSLKLFPNPTVKEVHMKVTGDF
ncbi:MAG: SprB repeat-containing protein [Saprospiraceae bacterium]|nr:SprB repeat-containing protein [Saprospiraceae bacterium]